MSHFLQPILKLLSRLAGNNNSRIKRIYECSKSTESLWTKALKPSIDLNNFDSFESDLIFGNGKFHYWKYSQSCENNYVKMSCL